MRLLIVVFVLIAYAPSVWSQPSISFTFDDGVTNDMPDYPFEEWNQMILDHLDSAGVKAVLFAMGHNKLDAKGKYLLKSWNDAGHKIGNHTFSHPNYSNAKMTFEKFKYEFLTTDTLINRYSNYIRMFRFPYLKEGNTTEKVAQFRKFMRDQKYRNGHVTIDASDWYVDSRLRSRLRENPAADIDGFRKFYLSHLLDRALYYEDLAFKLTGRHIRHTILLHHNLASALFLGDLITMFKSNGWNVVDAGYAFKDPVFESEPSNIPAGESLVWALAKESGKFEDILRYPAEDGEYEKEKMDALGL